MGEHGTWTDLLPLGGLTESLKSSLGRDWQAFIFGGTHFGLTHVFWAMAVLLFVAIGAMKFYRGATITGGIVPPRGFNLRNVFEGIADAALSIMTSVMGEKGARHHLPLIGSLGLFIFFSNLCGLIPGFGVPTATLKTNVALALIVFFATHYYGLKEHGASYIKQFTGPLWWLVPLMLPIEIISHLARPLSLSLRLMGNMAADHKVVFSFFVLFPALLPVPFMVLGLLVSVVQTLVFCLLAMVYISMATSHDH